MIPNAGLDNIAAYFLWGTANNTGIAGSAADASGSQWLAYAAISEDSTAPSASDTNIGVEKMRTNATGGFARTATAIRDTGTNRLGVSIERAYVFAITSSMNITKYGYVPVSSGGNFSWIDLVRSDPNDPLSSPITLTLQNGDELQLWQTFTITVPWSVDLESFVITGTAGNDTAGTHDAYCGFWATGGVLSAGSDSTADSLSNLILRLFGPAAATGPDSRFASATDQTPNAARDAPLATNTNAAQSAARVRKPYTSGTYYQDFDYKFGTAVANFMLTGIALTAGGGVYANRPANGYGFKIVFADPATFTKTNTHELTLTFRVSWAEA